MLDVDIIQLAERVLREAQAHELMLATAESCTGGLIAAALTGVAGASNVFERGFVTYSNAAKSELLGVDPDLIETHGAVSEPVAQAMAQGAIAASAADIAVAVTGVAGPGGGTALKPVGMVCFGLASRGESAAVTRRFGDLGRDAVRRASLIEGLELVLAQLAERRR